MEQAAALAEFRFTPAGVARALSRYRWRSAAFFVVAIAVGFASILMIGPEYQSDALLLVKFGQQQVYRAPIGSNVTPIAQNDSDLSVDMVNTQVQLLRSRDVIEPVIQQIGLARLYPDIVEEQQRTGSHPRDLGLWRDIAVALQGAIEFYRSLLPAYLTSGDSAMERALRRFQKDLTVQQARASLLLQVSYRNHDPTLARVALEDLIAQQRRVSAALDGSQRVTFYTSAVAQARQSLSDAGARLSLFRSQQGVVAFKEQLPMLLQQRQGLEQERERLDEALQGVEQRNAKLTKQLAALPTSVPAFAETEGGLHAIGVTRTVRNPLLGTVEAALQSSQAESADLNGRVAEVAKQTQAVDSRIGRASELDAQRTLLENDVAALTASLKNLTDRWEEAKLADELSRQESSSLSIAQKPTQPQADVPARPAPVRYMALAFVIGILSALTVAVTSGMFGSLDRHMPPRPVRAKSLMPQPSQEPGE